MNKTIKFSNIHQWTNVLNDVFKYNANNDLLLFIFNSHIFNVHRDLFTRFNLSQENETINFDIARSEYIENGKIRYNSTMRDLKNMLQQQYSGYNIFMGVQYLEKIDEDYIVIKTDNLLNYKTNINKKIIVFELHLSILSDLAILDEIMIQNEEFIFNTDFNKFHLPILSLVKENV